MIPIIKQVEDLEWYIDDTWSKVEFDPKDRKQAIMDWFYEECEDDIVLASIPDTPSLFVSPGGKQVIGLDSYNTSFTAYFRDVGEAMMFKLTWGG